MPRDDRAAAAPTATMTATVTTTMAAAASAAVVVVVFGPAILAAARIAAGGSSATGASWQARVTAVEAALFGVGVTAATMRWLARRAPEVAERAGWRQPRGSLLAGAAGYLAVSAVSVALGARLVGALGLRPLDRADGPGAGRLVVDLVSGAAAGFTEEVALLALPVAVLAGARSRLGRWTVPVTLACVVTLRLAVHLYYGWGAVFVLLWVPGAYALFRLLGSVWPLVLGHAAFDALAAVSQAYPLLRKEIVILMWLVAAAGTALVICAAGRRRPTRR